MCMHKGRRRLVILNRAWTRGLSRGRPTTVVKLIVLAAGPFITDPSHHHTCVLLRANL
jgi:hypothetical protein